MYKSLAIFFAANVAVTHLLPQEHKKNCWHKTINEHIVVEEVLKVLRLFIIDHSYKPN